MDILCFLLCILSSLPPSSPFPFCLLSCNIYYGLAWLLVMKSSAKQQVFGVLPLALSSELIDWESLSLNTGKCRILNWGSTLLCVPLLFVFLCALFWRERGRRDYLQICHWTKNINPWGSECAWSSLPRALCHRGQRWALKGDKDATLLTPELQSTR